MGKTTFSSLRKNILETPRNVMSVIGVVIKNNDLELYTHAADLANEASGDEFYEIAVPDDQTYNGIPVGEGRVHVLLKGKYTTLDDSNGGTAPFWDALKSLQEAQQKQAGNS